VGTARRKRSRHRVPEELIEGERGLAAKLGDAEARLAARIEEHDRREREWAAIIGEIDDRGITHEVEQVIEPTAMIVGCPSMQLGLDLQYPCLRLARRRPWCARVHRRPFGLPVPILQACWSPFAMWTAL